MGSSYLFAPLLALLAAQSVQAQQIQVPVGFPTSLFASYYIPPSPTQEVSLRRVSGDVKISC